MAVALIGCAPPNEYQAPPPPKVVVATPIVQTVISYLEETGTTEAVEMVKIRARVRGFIEEIKFKTEDEVAAGDVLYLIEKETYEAAVQKAKADLATAQANYVNADAQYKAELPLLESGGVSREQLEQRKADRSVAQASIYAAQAILQEKEIDLAYCEVKTPIAGRVGKTLIKKGNLVDGTEGSHLTTVINYDQVYGNFFISERVLQEIRQNSPARNESGEIDKESVKMELAREIDGEEFPFAGHLDYWGIEVDEATGTYPIRGIFDNADGDLIPGMTVRIRVPMKPINDAILVPEASIGIDQTGRYVLTVDGEDIVKRKSVELGPRFGHLQVISEGLEETDRVIINGMQRARLDAKVTTETGEIDPLDLDPVQTTSSADDTGEDLPAPPPEGTSDPEGASS